MSETSKIARTASDRKRFVAELGGTFVIVVLATGSAVLNAKSGGALGVPFEAVCRPLRWR